MRPSNSQTSIAHSMLNLSISPSSSSTMSSGIHPNQPYPLASTSSPSMSSVSMWPLSPPTSSGSTTSKRHELDKFLMEQQQQQQQHLPSPPNSARSTSSLKQQQQQHDHNNEWKTSGAIPSLMGKERVMMCLVYHVIKWLTIICSHRSTLQKDVCYISSRLHHYTLSHLSAHATAQPISHLAVSAKTHIPIVIFLSV